MHRPAVAEETIGFGQRIVRCQDQPADPGPLQSACDIGAQVEQAVAGPPGRSEVEGIRVVVRQETVPELRPDLIGPAADPGADPGDDPCPIRAKTAHALGIGVRTLSGKLKAYGYAPRSKTAA